MFLNQIPAHHIEETVEVFVDLLHRELALVDRIEPVFQERFRHYESGFFQQEFAHV